MNEPGKVFHLFCIRKLKLNPSHWVPDKLMHYLGQDFVDNFTASGFQNQTQVLDPHGTTNVKEENS
jgi:hypothetical protein